MHAYAHIRPMSVLASCAYVYVYACMCVNLYIYIYIYIHIYIHTHTSTKNIKDTKHMNTLPGFFPPSHYWREGEPGTRAFESPWRQEQPLLSLMRFLRAHGRTAQYGGVYVYMYKCMYVCMYVCIYIYTHICTYIYIYVHIHRLMFGELRSTCIQPFFASFGKSLTCLFCGLIVGRVCVCSVL